MKQQKYTENQDFKRQHVSLGIAGKNIYESRITVNFFMWPKIYRFRKLNSPAKLPYKKKVTEKNGGTVSTVASPVTVYVITFARIS